VRRDLSAGRGRSRRSQRRSGRRTGAGEEEEQADGARDCGGHAAGSPEESETYEEGAECGGEHGFHAVELIALEQRGGEEWNSDEGDGAQRAA